jgi:hypothetical protein
VKIQKNHSQFRQYSHKTAKKIISRNKNSAQHVSDQIRNLNPLFHLKLGLFDNTNQNFYESSASVLI